MYKLRDVIEQVGKDKGLNKSVLIDALESAMLTAARKKYGTNKEIEAHYNEELGEIELFQFKEVVEEVENPYVEISLEEARKEFDPEAQVGDSLGIKLDTGELGRIAAQTAKQVIIQKVREAERDLVYSEYKDRVGEIVTGIVQRFEKGDIWINLGRGEAILPKKEQIAKEVYRQGDRIRAYILEVDKFAKGPQVVLSRSHPNFLVKLFESEVPEIYEKIVEVKGVAREPGERAKIAVVSHNSDVDPVGACVGVKGMRVLNVVQELRGEKIDIVLWEEDPAKYICNALSPAQISKVIIDETEHSMEIVVPEDQLSIAIGKKGQNVRLAARLTGWKIDINSESEAKKKLQEERELLAKIPGVGESMAQILHSYGFRKIEDLAQVNIDLLSKVPSVGKKTASKIIEGAKKLLEKETSDEENKVLEAITGINEEVIGALKGQGFKSIDDILDLSEDDLMRLEGIKEEDARLIMEEARKIKDKGHE